MLQTGDEKRVKCGHCRRPIEPPVVLAGVRPGEVLETTGTCRYCGKENHFWARQAIRVDCEREDRVKLWM